MPRPRRRCSPSVGSPSRSPATAPRTRRARHRLRRRGRRDARASSVSPAPARASPRCRSWGCSPATRPIGGSIKLNGHELVGLEPAGTPQDPRQAGRHGVPGSADVAQPGHPGRQADRRSATHPQPGHVPRRRPQTLDRAAADGVDPRCPPPARQLPVRALGRHAPTGDDRDGDVQRPIAPHRRRADHRARCHRSRPRSSRCSRSCSDSTTSGSSSSPTTSASSPVSCSRLLVMYAGRVVEAGDVNPVFDEPGHPYTRGLLGLPPAARPAALRARADHRPTAVRGADPERVPRSIPAARTPPTDRATRGPRARRARPDAGRLPLRRRHPPSSRSSRRCRWRS